MVSFFFYYFLPAGVSPGMQTQPNYSIGGMMSPPPAQQNPQMSGMMTGMAGLNMGSPMGQGGMAQGGMGQGGMGVNPGMRPQQQQQQPMMMGMGQGQMGMGMGGGIGMNQMGMMGQQYPTYGAKWAPLYSPPPPNQSKDTYNICS